MGRAIRWFKSLFGIKNGKGREENTKFLGGPVFRRDPATIRPNITVTAEKGQKTDEIATAEAMVASVRLISHTRSSPSFLNSLYILAAIKIQSIFRGYLGRRALRGLRGVVKLQALVKGILVRKQAHATLLGMEALMRAQSIVRAQKFQSHNGNRDVFRHNYHVRKVKGRCDDYITTIHSNRIPSSFDAKTSSFNENSMVADVGQGLPKSRSRRFNNSAWDPSNLLFTAHRNNPTRLSLPDSQNHYAPDWDLIGDECRFSTTHSTPRFVHRHSRFAEGPNAPITTTKSVCRADYDSPNYMADTLSFRAKLRSKSAPRQRANTTHKTRTSLIDELTENRTSHSGARMQRSCSQARDVIAFKNIITRNLAMT